MPRPPKNPPPIPPHLVKVKAQGAVIVRPITQQVSELGRCITTDEQNGKAGEILSAIGQAQREWAAKVDPILNPLKDAKRAAEALDREIRVPLEQMEESIRSLMRAYALLKLAKQRELEEQKRQVEATRQADIAKLEEKLAKASRPAQVAAATAKLE